MTVFHSFSTEANKNRNMRLEQFNFFLDLLGNGEDLRQFFVAEITNDLSHGLVCIVDSVFDQTCIDFIERIINPALVTVLPSLNSCPQIVV